MASVLVTSGKFSPPDNLAGTESVDSYLWGKTTLAGKILKLLDFEFTLLNVEVRPLHFTLHTLISCCAIDM